MYVVLLNSLAGGGVFAMSNLLAPHSTSAKDRYVRKGQQMRGQRKCRRLDGGGHFVVVLRSWIWPVVVEKINGSSDIAFRDMYLLARNAE